MSEEVLSQKEVNLFEPVPIIVESLGNSYKYEWEGIVGKLVEDSLNSRGLSEYDITHLHAARDWAKVLGNRMDLPERTTELLSFAEQVHDIGYESKDGKKLLISQRKLQKPVHADISVKIVHEWISEAKMNDPFTQDEWDIIDYLIKNHDILDGENGMEKLVKERDMRLLRERIRKGTYDVKDLLYLMVAGDTFAQIDSTSGVKFDSDEVEMEKYIQNQYRRRSKMLVGVPGEIANILYNKYHMRSGLHKFDLTN